MFQAEMTQDERSPLSIRILSIEEYPLHYHSDIELIFVLDGQIRLLLGSNDYQLSTGDIFACNGKEVHGLYGSIGENVVALIRVNNRIFSNYYPNLARSCYRTNTADPQDERLSFLRRELTGLLLNYGENLRHQEQINVAVMKKILGYLEANFNYFTIRDGIVHSEAIDNSQTAKRISRIILRMYESYFQKLTLDELSRTEDLSSFYLSHLIREHTGLSFREFLAFARVESAQLLLLDESVELNDLHEMVGFSAKRYFDDHFLQWFGVSPEEYRHQNISKIKSEKRPERSLEITKPALLDLLRGYDAHQQSEDRTLPSGKGVVNISVDHKKSKSIPFQPQLTISVDPRDRKAPNILQKLQRFEHIQILEASPERVTPHWCLDTIAGAVYWLKKSREGSLQIPIWDPTDEEDALQGQRGLIFRNGIPKCSYYAMLFLSNARGRMIDSSANHWIIKKDAAGGSPSYVVLIYNGGEEAEAICNESMTREQVADAIVAYREELNMKLSIKGPAGAYKIALINIDSSTDYFHYVHRYGKQSPSDPVEQLLAEQYTAPYVNIYNADSTGVLDIYTRLDGICAQMISVTPLSV
ncbi:MAG: AraC family transcriptional regulator [Eubacteriales bacterium]|nr:AraC family transcriptional regulator [Eubacteriales bacterium]